MSKEETFFDRLSREEKISCTAHDEILNGKNPCAIVKDLYKQLAELKAENFELVNKVDVLESEKDNLMKTVEEGSEVVEENEQLKAENERFKEEHKFIENLHNYFETETLQELKNTLAENVKQGDALLKITDKLEQALKSNTKQVCEKIRTVIQRKREGQQYNFSEYCKGKDFAYLEIDDLLDQIEKGELNGN